MRSLRRQKAGIFAVESKPFKYCFILLTIATTTTTMTTTHVFTQLRYKAQNVALRFVVSLYYNKEVP